MRRLSRRNTLNLVKELDAFPKVPESYVKTSAFGGTVTLIVFILMALLTISEFFVYQDSWMKYEYEVDTDFTSQLKIKIDITVAMKCTRVGADVLDLSGSVIASKELKYDPVSFEPSPQKKMWYQNDYASDSQSACRIHGQIYVSKVAGNFHITLGKPIENIRGHAHFVPLIKNEVVPTKLHTSGVSVNMHQFSVTEQERVVNKEKGSHGVTGIFIKYKLSPLMD
ncbi:endoplasmic reticulum-Golgi intermediate compartment 2 [Labeo rohita]|uniref:Endoplasmic reticulum-Golgi intermediate compartment protein n=1 Tax=Labeo rohita TaxID=84645 RepID=A0A498LWH8_LABRO|nr:endoplasmic reticulum-Golgi intermediate compartment 2 [Labeo rohita]